MHLKFCKYQGTGNDFVLIDNRKNSFVPSADIIKKLANRKFGIGADGVILIENHQKVDFKMVYFNADGSQSLCGNGSRCAVSFAKSLDIINDKTYFETTDGFHHAFINNKTVSFELYDVQEIKELNDAEYFINTGSPHHIVLVQDVGNVDVFAEGRKIRNNPNNDEIGGTNVNFVTIANNQIRMRTYERGVEDETLSCGTGATAVAIALAEKFKLPSPIKLETEGGPLTIAFEKNKNAYHKIYLSGPATKVFEGSIEI